MSIKADCRRGGSFAFIGKTLQFGELGILFVHLFGVGLVNFFLN